ncbi:hypothetical protein D3C84_1223180 [compost metagenome]
MRSPISSRCSVLNSVAIWLLVVCRVVMVSLAVANSSRKLLMRPPIELNAHPIANMVPIVIIGKKEEIRPLMLIMRASRQIR